MLYSFGDLVSDPEHVKDDEDPYRRHGFNGSWDSINFWCSTGIISSLVICVTLHMNIMKFKAALIRHYWALFSSACRGWSSKAYTKRHGQLPFSSFTWITAKHYCAQSRKHLSPLTTHIDFALKRAIYLSQKTGAQIITICLRAAAFSSVSQVGWTAAVHLTESSPFHKMTPGVSFIKACVEHFPILCLSTTSMHEKIAI